MWFMLQLKFEWVLVWQFDQVEEDLLAEKYKIKKISDDLNQTFEDMINMSVWYYWLLIDQHCHRYILLKQTFEDMIIDQHVFWSIDQLHKTQTNLWGVLNMRV